MRINIFIFLSRCLRQRHMDPTSVFEDLRALVLLSKSLLFSHISEMLTSISQINEPIPGMFVLI